MKCPVCKSRDLEVFFEAEQVPVFANVLHGSRDKAVAAPRGDISLGYCAECGMIHNVAFDVELVTYAEGYENSLHCSPRFRRFAEELADRLVSDYALSDARIVEVGAHRGEFLDLLTKGGRNRGIGFDPSSPEALCHIEDQPFELRREYFDENSADHDVDLICCRHVLEHVPKPREFVRMIVKAAKQKSAVYMEVPNGLWTLRDLGIWDIIYEHCSYFVPSSLARLFSEEGLPRAALRETFGAQFLSLETSAANDYNDDQPASGSLEELDCLVQQFASSYQERVSLWREELREAEVSRTRVAIWGAGSKGVTFLNALGESPAIRCVIDINPLKQGKFVAGSGHTIIAPGLLPEDVQRVIVMNPLYLSEIGTQLHTLGFNGEVSAI